MPHESQTTKRILSLFDLTGNWSQPYRERDYEVIQIDLQRGFNLFDWNYKILPRDFFSGILAALPCTDFALSGAAHFKAKDGDGRTHESMSLTYLVLAIIQWFQPGLRWWVIENPMSRIHKLCPELGKVQMQFDPYEFAGHDPLPANSQYQKRTWLWGDFVKPKIRALPNTDGNKYHARYGGRSVKTKNARSVTPLGFAYAFYRSNP